MPKRGWQCIAGAAALAGLPVAAAPHPAYAVQESFAYHIAAESGGAAWGEWDVEQGPEVAVARTAGGGGEIVLLADGTPGNGVAFEPDPGGFLVEALAASPDFGAGFRRGSPYGNGTAAVDSMRFELREGDAPETIAGRATLHRVLTARLWWRHVHGDGTETPVEETGTADLWLAPDLPFSWVPFAIGPAQPAMAFPLSYSWPEAPAAAIRALEDRLAGSGLLLRARVIDQVRPRNAGDEPSELVETDYSRTITVSDVRPLEQPPDADDLAALPRIGRDRMAALRIAGSLLRGCRSLAPGTGGSFEFSTSGSREFLGGGSGALFGLEGYERGHPVVMGRFDGSRLDCTAILLPGDAPAPGTLPLRSFTGSGASEAGADEGALAVHAVMEGRVVHRMLLLESGEVTLTRAGSGELAGELSGRAWGLELDPAYPRALLPDLEIRIAFEAVPAAATGE